MKTKLKTMIGVLRPNTGKGNCVQPKFTLRKLFAVYLLAMVAQLGFAEERKTDDTDNGPYLLYDFTRYTTNDYLFLEDTEVTNSVGESMYILKDRVYGATGTRFAVAHNEISSVSGEEGSQVQSGNGWHIYGGGLYSEFSGYRALSIMGLSKGDKVKITFVNKSESRTINVRSSNVSGKTGNKDKDSNYDPLGDAITNNELLEITENGSLDLWVGRNIAITQVRIYDNLTTDHGYRISFDSSGKYGDNNWDGLYPWYRVQLSSRDFTEPAISTYPSTITINDITFSIEPVSTTVAVMNANPAYKGDVLFKNTGWCKVTASFTYEGTTYSDSYVVEVWEYDRTNYEIVDNTYRLTGSGILTTAQRTVTDVPGITMTFGNTSSNTAIIEERKDANDVSHYVSFMLANNGWWDRYPYNASGAPEEGTYYIFTANSAGTLTFGGYKTSTGGEVKIIKTSAGNVHTVVFDSNTQGYLTSPSIVMTPGTTYYMHGTTPTVTTGTNPWDSQYNNQWAVFELEWFKFETGFSIVDPDDENKEITYGVASGSGVTSVTTREKVSLDGVTVKDGSIARKGEVASASVTVNSDRTITFSGITYNSGKPQGGAIKVTLQNGGKEKDYVMTIPYGTHVWDFRESGKQGSGVTDRSYTDEQLCSMMKNNSTDWCRPYKVHNTTTGEYKDPIMAAKSPINGNNAFYMDNTAGLIFVTGNESFGAHQTTNSTSEYIYDPENATQYGYTYETITGTDLLWMKGNATIYFPGVSANQYIKIYTYRHADNKGETFSAKNLVDLDNVAYDFNTRFIMRGMWEDRDPGWVGDNIRGAAIFRVPNSYTPTQDLSKVPQLQLCDDGWTKIYRIEIMTDFKPDLMLTDDNGGTHYPVDYDGQFSSIVVRKNSRKDDALPYVDRSYLATTGQTGCQHANTCDYEIIADEGVVTIGREEWNSNPANPSKGTWYNNLKLRYNKAGRVRIVQRERANAAGTGVSTAAPSSSLGYVIDKNEYFVNVGELTVQNYPYTWDFTNYNMYKSPSTTKADLNKGSSGWNATESSETDKKTFGQEAVSSYTFGQSSVINSETQQAQNATINRAWAAQGAELRNSSGSILETQGLGISRPKTSKTYIYYATDHSDNKFKEMSRTYDGYTLTDNAIKVNGNTLTGVNEVTIPEVGDGMYIFIQASNYDNGENESNVPAGLTSLWTGYSGDKKDPFDVKGGVWIYKNNSGEEQDFTFKFDPNATINAIAVTDEVKTIYSTGYATESRDHAIDHTYQEKFTNHPVKAYAITTDATGSTYEYRKKAVVRKSEPITVVPSNTGVVLCQESYSGDDFSSPLFYPAVNITPTSDDYTKLATNRMAANVVSTEHESETEEIGGVDYTKFIMTTVSYTYHKEDGSNTQNTEATTEAFYRMKLDATAANNVIGENKAYLLVPTANLPTALWNEGSSSSRGIIYIDLEDVENSIEATKIDNQAIIDHSTDNNVYYSISGARINGKPTIKGFYIHNGKKVSIK